MTSNEILHADHLDILFNNRNKQYGAYVLRRTYNARLWSALGISLSLFVLFFIVFRPDKGTAVSADTSDMVTLRDFKIPEKIKTVVVKEERHEKTEPAVAQRKFTDKIAIVKNEKKLQDFSTQDELNQATPGTTHTPGAPITGTFVHEKPPIADIKPPVPPEVPMIQSEPEFPGGSRAWLGFLQKNLRVPGDLGENEKKTVLIRFQVTSDGSVTAFEILNSGGNIYDNEVIRVLKKMPKWKPAIQNNQPVARSFTQPVTFMGLSD